MEDDIRELKRQIQRMYEMNLDTNRLVHKMYRAQRLGQFFSLLRWVVVIAISVGAYLYLTPLITAYVNQLQDALRLGGTVTEQGYFGSMLKNLESVTSLLPGGANEGTVE